MKHAVWLSIFFALLIWSGIEPHDRLTWVMEVLPAVAGAAVLYALMPKHPPTELAYWLILIHCAILIIGGHYTYAHVPLFEWLREATDGSRNNYDKLGHFAQGFVPVILAREVVLRLQVFNKLGWCHFFVVCFCLAFSAFYEFIEWWAALIMRGSAEQFLGMQGYVWDTQSDMLYATIGAICALLILSGWHSRQLAAKRYISFNANSEN